MDGRGMVGGQGGDSPPCRLCAPKGGKHRYLPEGSDDFHLFDERKLAETSVERRKKLGFKFQKKNHKTDSKKPGEKSVLRLR